MCWLYEYHQALSYYPSLAADCVITTVAVLFELSLNVTVALLSSPVFAVAVSVTFLLAMVPAVSQSISFGAMVTSLSEVEYVVAVNSWLPPSAAKTCESGLSHQPVWPACVTVQTGPGLEPGLWIQQAWV